MTEDAIDIIEEEARVVGQFFSVKDATRLAKMLADRIVERLGGQLVYVAKRARAVQAERNAGIRLRFDGRNYAEIAREEGLSESQVRRIVHTQK